MSYLLVAVLVLGAGGAAGFLAWATRRTFRLESLQRHHEVGGAVFLQLGVIYAVLLAFVFSEVWGEYNTAANAISQECGSLHGASILASALPPPAGDQIDRALRTYIETVIGEEWPAMRMRNPSAAARPRPRHSSTWPRRRAARRSLDDATRSQLMTQLASAHQWRETRLFQMTLHVPGLVWVLLIGIALVLVGFLLCFGIEYVGSQVVFTAVFAASIALVLALVHCLDFPFQGALRLQPDEFRATLQAISGDRGG